MKHIPSFNEYLNEMALFKKTGATDITTKLKDKDLLGKIPLYYKDLITNISSSKYTQYFNLRLENNDFNETAFENYLNPIKPDLVKTAKSFDTYYTEVTNIWKSLYDIKDEEVKKYFDETLNETLDSMFTEFINPIQKDAQLALQFESLLESDNEDDEKAEVLNDNIENDILEFVSICSDNIICISHKLMIEYCKNNNISEQKLNDFTKSLRNYYIDLYSIESNTKIYKQLNMIFNFAEVKKTIVANKDKVFGTKKTEEELDSNKKARIKRWFDQKYPKGKECSKGEKCVDPDPTMKSVEYFETQLNPETGPRFSHARCKKCLKTERKEKEQKVKEQTAEKSSVDVTDATQE